ncbi:hypothetical protein [Streptomyces tubercidicus]
MTATVPAMMLWGLPQDEPKPKSTGTLTSGSITLTTDTPEPVNPKGPYGERMSVKRFEKALRVVIDSALTTTALDTAHAHAHNAANELVTAAGDLLGAA